MLLRGISLLPPFLLLQFLRPPFLPIEDFFFLFLSDLDTVLLQNFLKLVIFPFHSGFLFVTP